MDDNGQILWVTREPAEPPTGITTACTLPNAIEAIAKLGEGVGCAVVLDLASFTRDDAESLLSLASSCAEKDRAEVFGLHDGRQEPPIELRDCLVHDIVIVPDLCYVIPLSPGVEPALEVRTLHGRDRRHEYVTLLGTRTSGKLLLELSNAVAEMRRRSEPPIWDAAGQPITARDSFSGPYDWPQARRGVDATYTRDNPPTLGRSADLAPPALIDLLRTSWRAQSREILTGIAGKAGDWDAGGVNPPHPPALLLQGETGTGKSLTAKILHEAVFAQAGDPVAGAPAPTSRPLVHVSAPSLTRDRFRQDFFGHTADVYTDADARAGYALQAAFGTLFIDEIGDLTADTQETLLTFLDTRSADVPGFSGPIFLPLQIIAATNRDLDAMVARGEFRNDLLARFAIRVTLEPLRTRLRAAPNEADRLVRHILENPGINRPIRRGWRRGELSVTGIDRAALDRIVSHDFRDGNFRELEQALRAAVLNARRYRSKTIVEGDIELRSGGTQAEGRVEIAVSYDEFRRLNPGMAEIPVSSISELSCRPDATLVRDSDGKAFVMADGKLWVEGEFAAREAHVQAKFLAPEGAAENLRSVDCRQLTGPGEVAATLGDPARSDCVDRYLDTEARCIWRSGHSLRVRTPADQERKTTLTLIPLVEPDGAMHARSYFRVYYDRAIQADEALALEADALEGVPAALRSIVVRLCRHQPAVEHVRLTQERLLRNVTVDDDVVAVLSVDRVALGGADAETWEEVELLPADNVSQSDTRLAQVCRWLLANGFSEERRSKYQHALELLEKASIPS